MPFRRRLTPRGLYTRLAAPYRPRLSAALSAVLGDPLAPANRKRALAALGERGATSGAEAWETLAARDVIPLDWVGAATRVFMPTRSALPAARFSPSEQWFAPLDAPPSARAAVTLAADPVGVATAESLAREFALRIRPWRVATDAAQIAWRVDIAADVGRARGWPHRLAFVELSGYVAGATLRGPLASIAAAVMAAWRRAGQSLVADEPRIDAWPSASSGREWMAWCAQSHVKAHGHWSRAATLGLTVPSGPFSAWYGLGEITAPPELVGRAFRELGDPFAVLIDLWRTGYVIEDVCDGFIVLAARMV